MAASMLLLMATMAATCWGRAAGDCNKPPALENGMLEDEFISTPTFESGSTVRYRCIPGYVMVSGSRFSITCNGNVWGELQARCQLRSCGSPGEILNGKATTTSNTFGSTVTFTCDAGYQLVGRATRYCEVQGWSGQVPTCEAVKCSDLPAIENGKSPRTPSGEDFWGYGMVAEFSCNDGYSLIGPSSIICEAAGEWSGAAPKCKDVKCPNPNTPAHGDMIGGFADVYVYGHEITFRCKEGYVMKGKRVIKCGENNTFVPAPPTCQSDVKCPNPKLSEHLNIPDGSKSVYRKDDEIEFACNDGYVMVGESVIKCGGDSKFDHPPPTCKRDVKCPNPKLSEHLNIPDGSKSVYRNDDVIKFACNDGYVMVGESVIKCGGDSKFDPPPPTCERGAGASKGKTVGIVIGVLCAFAFACAIAGVGYYLCKKSKGSII
ncbi:C4b-binding protein-like isoform X2 [Leucoraja erinacea]|uniref:C4b-binding protein-like isoform X2 n=1 Tax=Leucoraja erinaceus TaxID=7782 RepID=UPI0024576562|nr:C4b-binding protein-like isoform X2 [Leucoraja erinacea]